jgi:hypothetical protein
VIGLFSLEHGAVDAKGVKENDDFVVEKAVCVGLVWGESVTRCASRGLDTGIPHLTFEYSTTENEWSSPPENFFIDFLILNSTCLFAAMVGSTVTTPLYPRYRICITDGVYRRSRKAIPTLLASS